MSKSGSAFSGNAVGGPGGHSHYIFCFGLIPEGLAIQNFHDWDESKKALDTGSGDVLSYFGNPSFTYQVGTANGSFSTKTITSARLRSILDELEDKPYKKRILDFSTSDEKQIRDIIGSRYGYLSGYATANKNSTNNEIRVFFTAPGNERFERTPALKTDTLFAGFPRRKSGEKYDFSSTFESSKHVGSGVYVGKELSDEDIGGMVAAPLKMIYNHNTKVFEAYSTFLCLLVEDIEPPDMADPGVTRSDLDTIKPKAFYGGDLSVAEFTTGLAVPLSVQGNNPHNFGPNFFHYHSDEPNTHEDVKIERVRVVNRSNARFDKGEIALVEQIDGENILIKISDGAAAVQRPPQYLGQWKFTKQFVSSDYYYRNGPGGNRLLPDAALEGVWSRWKGDNQDTTLNTYWQTTAFDQSKTSWGGSLPGNAYSPRINVSVGIDGNEATALDSVETDAVSMFWGPLFTNGYAQALKDANDDDIDGFQFPAELATLSEDAPIYYPNFYCEKVNQLDGVDPETKRTFANSRFNANRFLNSGASGRAATPNDSNTIQFSLMSADLYGHLDETTTQIDSAPFEGTSNAGRKKARNFYKTFQTYTGLGAGVNAFGNNDFFRLRTNQYQHLYTSPKQYTGPAYDCFIQYKPLSGTKPKGTFALFGGDDLEANGPSYYNHNEAYIGANAVGITCGRRKLIKSGGAWTLNVNTEQVFGTNGRFFGGGQGAYNSFSILPSIVGLIMLPQSYAPPKIITGWTVAWGSGGDFLDEFGTAALYVQVWDGWPEEDTMWISNYNILLHFNPGAYGSGADKEVDDGDGNNIEVADLKYDCDYKVPTYLGGSTIIDGQTISSSTKFLSSDKWKGNYWRRGQLVTKKGYYWDELVIGLNESAATIIAGGGGFEEDDIYDLGKGAKIKITSTNGGAISGWEFVNTDDIQESISTYDSTLSWDMKGEGFEPDDFPISFEINPYKTGSPATIKFTTGKVWSKPRWDYGPKPQSNLTRCSLPSGPGQKRLSGYKDTQIGVNSNADSPHPGLYEVITHCHNDVGIFVHTPDHETGTSIQMHNYIKMTLS